MTDLRDMTTGEAEAFRAGWRAAAAQVQAWCDEWHARIQSGQIPRGLINDAVRSHNDLMDVAKNLRATEPGE